MVSSLVDLQCPPSLVDELCPSLDELCPSLNELCPSLDEWYPPSLNKQHHLSTNSILLNKQHPSLTNGVLHLKNSVLPPLRYSVRSLIDK